MTFCHPVSEPQALNPPQVINPFKHASHGFKKSLYLKLRLEEIDDGADFGIGEMTIACTIDVIGKATTFMV